MMMRPKLFKNFNKNFGGTEVIHVIVPELFGGLISADKYFDAVELSTMDLVRQNLFHDQSCRYLMLFFNENIALSMLFEHGLLRFPGPEALSSEALECEIIIGSNLKEEQKSYIVSADLQKNQAVHVLWKVLGVAERKSCVRIMLGFIQSTFCVVCQQEVSSNFVWNALGDL